MLLTEVKAHLTGLLMKTYTKGDMRLLAGKLGIPSLQGIWKRHLAEDLLSKVPNDKENELIQRVICDARKLRANEEINEALAELEPILETMLHIKVDKNGRIVPTVEPSIKLDFEKEKGFLEEQMKKHGFKLAHSHLRGALDTYKTSYSGSIALFRNSLQALVEEIIKLKKEIPFSGFADNLRKLIKLGILKKFEKDEEYDSIYSLFKMLSHYGSHPEYATAETAQFLYIWTISTLSFLMKRFEASI